MLPHNRETAAARTLGVVFEQPVALPFHHQALSLTASSQGVEQPQLSIPESIHCEENDENPSGSVL